MSHVERGHVLRPPIAQERITRGPDGLVRIALKKRFSDGTFAVDLDPLSLLTRLCASVPPPRFHAAEPRPRRCRYRPWAELMRRTFALDVLCCPRCSGRLRFVALMTEPMEIRRYLRALGERTDAPERSPARGPPYWRS